MITVCFLPSAEHYYATRVISPTSTAVPLPLPIEIEVVSPDGPSATKVKALTHEAPIQIPAESLGIPDIEILLQENIIDIGLHTPNDTGSQGVGTLVANYPCFQMGASTSQKPKRRPRPSCRSLAGGVVTQINQLLIPCQRTPHVPHTTTLDTAGPISTSASSATLLEEEVLEAQRTPQRNNRLRRKRKVDQEALTNPEGAMLKKQCNNQERVINPIPQQLASARCKARKAQSRKDKKANISKKEASQEIGAQQLMGLEASQDSGAPTLDIQHYFKMKRQRPELESQDERQNSQERKRRGVSSSMSSGSSV